MGSLPLYISNSFFFFFLRFICLTYGRVFWKSLFIPNFYFVIESYGHPRRRISWFLVMVEASLGTLGRHPCELGSPPGHNQFWGPLCPLCYHPSLPALSRPHLLPGEGREDTSPHPSDTHAQRGVCARSRRGMTNVAIGALDVCSASPSFFSCPLLAGDNPSGFLCFPSFVPGLAEESLPELPAVLESVMKSPACRRKGLCLYGWWGSMPGCAWCSSDPQK